MKKKRNPRTRRIFIIAFFALTFLCWCPWLYGPYGPTRRILGVPMWTVLAAVFGVVLFILEWIYLFRAGMALTDEELPEIVSELDRVNAEDSDSPKETE